MSPVFYTSHSLDSFDFVAPTKSGEGSSSDPLVWVFAHVSAFSTADNDAADATG